MTTQAMTREEAEKFGVPLYSPDGVNWYPATGEVDIAAVYQSSPEYAKLVAEGKALAPTTVSGGTTTTPDLTKQIDYWQTQIKQAEDVLAAPDDIEHPLDRAEVQRNIDTYQANIDLLQQHLEYDVVPSPEVNIITNPAMQPYISVTKDGQYDVDVSGIIRSGADPMTLKQLGITEDAIDQVKALNKLITYKTAGGGYDITKAIEDGKESALIAAGFKQSDINATRDFIKKQSALPQVSVTQGDTLKLTDGTEVYKSDMDNLRGTNPQAYDYIMANGLDAYYKNVDDAYNKMKPYISGRTVGGHEVDIEGNRGEKSYVPKYDIQGFIKDHPGDRQTLLTLGFDMKDILAVETSLKAEGNKPEALKDADVLPLLSDKSRAEYPDLSAEDKYSILVSEGIVPESAGYQGKNSKGEPIVRTTGLTKAGTFMWNLPIDNLIINSLPIVGTVRTWNDMGVMGKTISIVTDILSFIPIVGATAKGARQTVEVGRAARLKGAVSAFGKASLAEVAAPATVILHPIETVKSTFGSLREIVEIGNVRKLPQAVITTTYGTVRLPVNMATSERDALKIRNTIMDLVAKGERPVIEVNGVKYELGTSALMREVGGGLSHATAQGDEFIHGIKVLEKPGKPLSEQGLFLSNEPLPRFVQQSAFGITGDTPTIIILSKKTAMQAVDTDKLYMSQFGKVAEMEKKFPVGFEIPEPKQRLFTRIGDTKVMILLEEPLTMKQIAKLKALALIEDLKAPFSPAIMVSGMKSVNSLDDLADAGRIADILRASGNRDVARSFMTAYRTGTRARADTSRGRITDNIDIRRTGAGGRTVTDRITVRATGTPRSDLRLPGRTARVDMPLTLRRPTIPTDLSRIPARARAESTPAGTRTAPPTESRRVITETETQRVPRTDRGLAPFSTSRVYRIPEPRRPPSIPPERRPPERPPDRPEPPTTHTKAKLDFSGEGKKGIPLPKGSVAWKQGFGWWVMKPPYYRKDMFFTFREPEGVTVHRNVKSAYDTIQSLRGNVTDKIPKIDMGIMDVHITKPPRTPTRRNRQAIRFNRDPSVKSRHKKSGIKNRKVGVYYTSGNMVSRHPIGKRRKV